MDDEPYDKTIDILYEDKTIPPHDQTPENEGYLLVRTSIPPILIDSGGAAGKEYRLDLPQETYKIHLKVSDGKIVIDELFPWIIKIQSYLAFSFQFSVPYAYLISTKSNYWTSNYNVGAMSSSIDPDFFEHIRDPVKYEDSWRTSAEQKLAAVGNLIKSVKVGEPLDEVITKIGHSVFLGDPEQSFVLQWHAMEILGNEFLNSCIRSYKEGKEVALSPYLSRLAEKLMDKKNTHLLEADKIQIMLDGYGVEVTKGQIELLRTLRNRIIHSTLEFSDLVKYGSEIREFYLDARKATICAIKNEGIELEGL